MTKRRRISKKTTRRYQRDFRASPRYRLDFARLVLPRAMRAAIQGLSESLAAVLDTFKRNRL